MKLLEFFDQTAESIDWENPFPPGSGLRINPPGAPQEPGRRFITQDELRKHGEWATNAFDVKYQRRYDNPLTKRGDSPATRDWLKDNPQAITSWYEKELILDPAMLEQLPGSRGEHTRMNSDDSKMNIAELVNSMKAHGWTEGAVLVGIDQDGSAHVVEGNHRIRAADQSGLTGIPIEWRWYGGSELTSEIHPMLFQGRARSRR